MKKTANYMFMPAKPRDLLRGKIPSHNPFCFRSADLLVVELAPTVSSFSGRYLFFLLLNLPVSVTGLPKDYFDHLACPGLICYWREYWRLPPHTRIYTQKNCYCRCCCIAIDFRNNLDNLAASGDIYPQENADEFASNHGRWLVLDDA